MKTVALQSVGCKLNQAEMESLAWRFADAGFEPVAPGSGADIYVLNTCTVTHVADRKSRHYLRLAQRRDPKAFVVAIGCYAERAPEEVAPIEGVDLLVGNRSKERVVEMVQGRVGGPRSFKATENKGRHYFRTRSLVKIQDGCSELCSFCIVPKVRGRGRSLPRERVIDEVKKRVAAGYTEVVLTGTQIGAYEEDGKSLEGLVSDILAQTGVQRLRLTSIHPQDLTPAFLSLWRDQRLCRHIHLPLQSGSNAVLGRMERRYSTSDYARAVALAREAVPDLSITTDVIVGFPGESEKEFEESYRFCEDMDFAALHVFPYSPREGTPAANRPNLARPQVKKERSARMLHLAARSAQRFRERFMGRTLMVLWEENREEVRGRKVGGAVGRRGEIKKGLTDNYIRVHAHSGGALANRVQPARLVASYGSGLWAEAV